MTAFYTPSPNRSSDESTDRALRDLLGPARPPTFHEGFERRLERALAADREQRQAKRAVRWILWGYWSLMALVSTAILWKLQGSLVSGPGVWVGAGGIASLLFAVLSFSLLARLPTTLFRWGRSPGR